MEESMLLLQQHEVRSHTDSQEDTRELPDSITAFFTLNHPVLDTILKDMLVSLRRTIHTDMMACMRQFSSKLTAVGDWVDHIEVKMGEYATINDLVDVHDTVDEEQNWIKAKLADLDDKWGSSSTAAEVTAKRFIFLGSL